MYWMSWEERKTFCEKLSGKLVLEVRLPTEAPGAVTPGTVALRHGTAVGRMVGMLTWDSVVSWLAWTSRRAYAVRQRGTEAVNFPPWEGEFEVRQYGHVSDFCRFFTDSRAIKSFPATHTSF